MTPVPTALELHERAARIARSAQSYALMHRSHDAANEYRLAAQFEERAARLTAGQPERATLFYSAAEMLFSAGAWNDARNLINEAPTDNPPPPADVVEELQDLLEAMA